MAECLVCGEGMDLEKRLNVVECTTCATPHHGDCFDYAGKCAVYGCYEKSLPVPRNHQVNLSSDAVNIWTGLNGGVNGFGQTLREEFVTGLREIYRDEVAPIIFGIGSLLWTKYKCLLPSRKSYGWHALSYLGTAGYVLSNSLGQAVLADPNAMVALGLFGGAVGELMRRGADEVKALYNRDQPPMIEGERQAGLLTE